MSGVADWGEVVVVGFEEVDDRWSSMLPAAVSAWSHFFGNFWGERVRE